MMQRNPVDQPGPSRGINETVNLLSGEVCINHTGNPLSAWRKQASGITGLITARVSGNGCRVVVTQRDHGHSVG